MQPTPDTPESWDAASQGYADRVAPFLMEEFADALIDRLGVDSNSDVLEVGAGSGALTMALFPRVKSVLATDFSPAMIDLLSRRLRAAEAKNVRSEVMDGQGLTLDDDGFDAAASSFAVMLFPDRARGFAELARVVRPRGRVVVSAWAGPDKFEVFGLLLTAMQAAFPDMPPPASPPPIFSLADPARFEQEMQVAGFRNIEIDTEARELEVASFDEMWEMLTVGAPPVQMLLDRVGDEGRNRLRDGLRKLIDQRFGEGPIRTTNVATIGSGDAP